MTPANRILIILIFFIIAPSAMAAKKEVGSGEKADSVQTAAPSPFVPGYPVDPKWESEPFKKIVCGISVGDIDGDGLMETVFITDQEVFAMKHDENGLGEPRMIGRDRFNQYVGIDIADIDKNGIDEIYVTGLNAGRNYPDSMVLEWDKTKFRRIVSSGPWYFRVTDGSAKRLLGQRNATHDPFSGDICEMRLGALNPSCTGGFALSAKINLLGFSMGYVGKKGICGIAFDKKDRICFTYPDGKMIPAGNDAYGGGALYANLPKSDSGQMENPEYLPLRLLIRDMDGDGKGEILTAVNNELADRRLASFRKFSGSYLTALSWDGARLKSLWQTVALEGFVRDFVIGDFDNDKKEELIAAVVDKDQATLFSSPEFRILAWEIKNP